MSITPFQITFLSHKQYGKFIHKLKTLFADKSSANRPGTQPTVAQPPTNLVFDTTINQGYVQHACFTIFYANMYTYFIKDTYSKQIGPPKLLYSEPASPGPVYTVHDSGYYLQQNTNAYRSQ